MNLTDQQKKAVDLAMHLVASGEVGALLGYAGTGKTTVLKEVAEQVDSVIMLAPTGRAALRVTEATGIQASTIHRWAYKVAPDNDGGDVAFELRSAEEIECPSGGLIISDEGSMVNAQVDGDLRKLAARHGCGLLYVGDPFQLMPVGKDAGSALDAFDFDKPNTVILTEIHRQALDSPIIRASMRLRKGEGRASIDELEIIRRGGIVDRSLDILDAGGAVIVHANKTRQAMNLALREGYGLSRTTTLTPGEKLVVLKNNYRLNRFNGEVLVFAGFTAAAMPVAIDDYRNDIHTTVNVAPAIVGGNEVYLCVEEAWGAIGQIPPWVINKAINNWLVSMLKAHSEFRWLPYLSVNMGYAMTCHKMQGMSAPSVAIMMEGQVRVETDEGARWLYTALTRAEKHVVIGYIGRGTELVAHAVRPLRAMAAVSTIQHLPHMLVFNDTSSLVRKQLEGKLAGQLLVDVDLKLEDKGRAPDFERAAGDYPGGLVVVAKQDGGYTKRGVLICKAFLAAGRTVMTWREGSLVRVDQVASGELVSIDGKRLVASGVVEKIELRIVKLQTRIADVAAAAGERQAAQLALDKAQARLAAEQAAKGAA